MHSVEFLPDEATDRAVRDVWRRLANLGLPSQAAHPHPTNRPHLTVGTADVLPAETRAALKEAVAVLPVPLRLDRLLWFPGRRPVLAWAVRPDDALLGLHEKVWRILRAAPESGPSNPLLAPGGWIPHITLGRGRDAVRPRPADEQLLGAGAEQGGQPGSWTEARQYDSVTRTTDRLSGPDSGQDPYAERDF